VNKRTSQIKNVLEKLYARYNHRDLIKPDPLQFVYKYSNRADMEIAGFLSASLAYGRVEQIEKSLTKLFSLTGNSPFDFTRNLNKKSRQKLKSFKHRFTKGDDISDLLELFRRVIKKYGSIEEFFAQGYSKDEPNIISALSKFCRTLLQMHAEKHDGHISKGLKYLLTDPANGSTCKRMNLFLRWMVRNDDVDAGLWRSIDSSKLIVPVDVHMSRLCRILGFYEQKTVSLKTALQITKGFAEIEPSDPVRYDFALSRVGIIENCTGKHRKDCQFCELFSICFK